LLDDDDDDDDDDNDDNNNNNNIPYCGINKYKLRELSPKTNQTL